MLKSVPVIVLCGGLGTRLRATVPDKPKVLAPIGEKSLLDIVISKLRQAGFENIILSVGYRREQVISHCRKCDYAVTFSEEETPLGTGGALKAALRHAQSNHFFVMNGDMIFDPDFSSLYQLHLQKNSLFSMALTRRYVGQGGNVVTTNADRQIVGWREKIDTDEGKQVALNAGVYVMHRSVEKYFPDKEHFSLEQDVFPVLFNTKRCYGVEHDGIFIDIGVPDRYKTANELLKQKAYF